MHILTLKHYILLKEEDGGASFKTYYTPVFDFGKKNPHDQVVAGISE